MHMKGASGGSKTLLLGGTKIAGGGVSKSMCKHTPPRGVWGHAPPTQKILKILGPLRWVLVQSESFMPASLIVIP